MAVQVTAVQVTAVQVQNELNAAMISTPPARDRLPLHQAAASAANSDSIACSNSPYSNG